MTLYSLDGADYKTCQLPLHPLKLLSTLNHEVRGLLLVRLVRMKFTLRRRNRSLSKAEPWGMEVVRFCHFNH